MTTYTQQERKLIATAFSNALKVLPDIIGGVSDRRSQYICDTLDLDPNAEACELAREVVSERIDGEFSLDTWLQAQSKKIEKEVKRDYWYDNGRKMQAYRKAWLRSLIKEFST